MGACHRRPLSLLSVRRGWAIGSPVIVDEAVGMWLGIQSPGMLFGIQSPFLLPFQIANFLVSCLNTVQSKGCIVKIV